jgi:hypothetical protein
MLKYLVGGIMLALASTAIAVECPKGSKEVSREVSRETTKEASGQVGGGVGSTGPGASGQIGGGYKVTNKETVKCVPIKK